ncbi:HTH-type transcriptional activator Btr [Clostridium homopropionicum DSM 5847]|uniref:HTH-type transcriptional activator Btr n=1 Tax=Clostridium homopropionicum DSM 5847 TaxID=1121318 RepID=A0A0L6ZAJ8_9CLOT|nr:AraC family transcriptional regulator [Clostridium homopropionicum]KOA19803.1 HTH-type transcriptional activator Btr [Clostridium homopropionicum DSM 5847]SFF77132.1 transcriptional regulator, AraC family [Clostridium homopropionicum]
MEGKGIRYYFNDMNGNIEIKNCSNSVHSSRAHFHNEVSIALVESGVSRTEIGDAMYEITGNTFLIIPPGVVHKCNPYNYNDWNFRMLYISPSWFESAFNIKGEQIKFSYVKLNKTTSLAIINLLNNIENNIIDVEGESRLLNSISLLFDAENTNKEISKITYQRQLDKTKEFLDANYLSTITLDDLIQVSGISKYYLIRQFENSYGLSPHKYITNLRVNHSKELLKTSMDFSAIALESGFYDQSHFSKCFKEYTGVTPKKYRNNFTL